MPYVPIDVDVYTAAFTGAMAGMTATMGTPIAPLASGIVPPSRYAGFAIVAGSFAEEFDTQWAAYLPATTLTEMDLENISSLSESAWTQRAALANFKTSAVLYTQLVRTLIAWCKAAAAYYALNGITPPPVPGGGTTSLVLIWRPGTPSADNHVESWAEVDTAIVAAGGVITILLDDTIAPCVVPATANTDCLGNTIFGNATAGTRTVYMAIDDGGRIRNPASFENFIYVYAAAPSVVSPLFFDIMPYGALVLRFGGSLICGGGAVPMVSIASTLFYLNCQEEAGLFSAGVELIEIPAGGDLEFYVYDSIQTTFGANIFKGAVGTALNTYCDLSYIGEPQPSFLGTPTTTLEDKPAVIFDDAVFSNRSNVRTDRIAQSPIMDKTKSGQTNFGLDNQGVPRGINGAPYATIGGGLNNEMGYGGSSLAAVLAGGEANIVDSDWGVCGGGTGNNSSGETASTIAGGRFNTVTGDGGFIGGGNGNTAGDGGNNVCTGGTGNTCSGGGVIGGGSANTCSGGGGVIGGGSTNTASSVYGTIGGGSGNTVNPEFGGTIAGGNGNFINQDHGAIGGGSANSVTGTGGTVAGGQTGFAGQWAAVGGGYNNKASAIGSAIAGGIDGLAYRQSQQAHSGGMFAFQGDAQDSRYIVKGTALPAIVYVVLTDTDGNQLQLEEGKAYAIRARCLANRTDASDRAQFVNDLLVHVLAGVVVIDADNATIVQPNGTAWSIAYVAGAGVLIAGFSGTAGQTVRAMVDYDFSEVGSL